MRQLPCNIVGFLRRLRRNVEWEKTLLEWIEAEDNMERKVEYCIDEVLMKVKIISRSR